MSQGFKHYCRKCGAKVEPDDAFCVSCGAKLDVGASATPSASGGSAPVTPANKPRNKAGRLLVVAVIAAAAYFGAQWLGGQMAGSFRSARPTVPPIALNTPIATLPPAVTAAPIATAGPVPTALPRDYLDSMIEVPTMPPVAGRHWNYLEATDDAISDTLSYFWYGVDNATNAKCAFFMNKETTRGGYYWWLRSSEGFQANFDVGDLVDYGSDTEAFVISRDGEETRLALKLHDDGSLDFNFGPGQYIIGSLRLYPDVEHRQEVLDMILNYKRTLGRMK